MLPLPQGDDYGYATGIDGEGNISGFVGMTNNGGGAGIIPVVWLLRRLAGDATLDGTVGFDDLIVLAKNYNKPGEWVDGDFNGDGIVNFADLVILAQNYGKSQPLTQTYSVQTAIPEPAVSSLLVTAAIFALPRRRRADVRRLPTTNGAY